MTEDDNDRSTWQEAKLHFLRLTQADTEEQFDEAVRKPTADKGQTDNWKLGLVINTAQIVLGVALYVFTSGLISWAGVILAVIAALAIIKWVLGL
jgi:hypothetical protein